MRLFVSVRPSSEAVEDLLRRVRGPAERWHVTLAFLGEQPAAAPYDDAVADAVRGRGPFRLRLAGGGSFGRATWAGVEGDVEALRALQADVTAACRAAGAELERRRYRPHLTVARGIPPRVLDGYAGPEWVVQEVELVRSTLGAPVVHEVLSRHPLVGP